ncbi:N-acetyltransferase [Capnocytophaga cynodegmi]|uniref:GNAT family N-acetyltransferase n=1 Tax=Capnocytophaga cynodegmi TaxID=28189 RepID=UPI001ACB18F2|nr:GNAT family N-acetyltransferase [Capnocytophaga cynodegmi]GIM52675.1 N-acetyltransferase [Capnocytophaga cynodegmi]
MSNFKELTLEKFTLDILEKSWNWLNDGEIKQLTQTPNFTKEEQRIWYNGLEKNPNYFVKGIKYDGKIIGVVGLKKINFENKQAEYFGYIGEKEYWGKGLSSKIFEIIIEECRKMGITHLFLNVIPENKRAIRAYEKAGFRQTEISENNIKMVLTI